jgi:hypothetical protein
MLTTTAVEAKIRQLFEGALFLTSHNVFIIVRIAYTVLWLIYILFISHLRKVPGPFLARITRLYVAATELFRSVRRHDHQTDGHGILKATCLKTVRVTRLVR